jgi:hypothetical protein
MEDRVTPQRGDAGDLRRLVAQALRHQDDACVDGLDAVVARDRDRHAVGVGLDVEHQRVDDLDVRELAQLAAAGALQRRGRAAEVQEAADRAHHRVRRAVGVHDEHALPGAPEHERGAEARGPASDDHDVSGVSLFAAGHHVGNDSAGSANSSNPPGGGFRLAGVGHFAYAVTATPPRRGSPPPVSPPLSGSRATACTPPK